MEIVFIFIFFPGLRQYFQDNIFPARRQRSRNNNILLFFSTILCLCGGLHISSTPLIGFKLQILCNFAPGQTSTEALYLSAFFF
jgi:hypothetical protein